VWRLIRRCSHVGTELLKRNIAPTRFQISELRDRPQTFLHCTRRGPTSSVFCRLDDSSSELYGECNVSNEPYDVIGKRDHCLRFANAADAVPHKRNLPLPAIDQYPRNPRRSRASTNDGKKPRSRKPTARIKPKSKSSKDWFGRNKDVKGSAMEQRRPRQRRRETRTKERHRLPSVSAIACARAAFERLSPSRQPAES
jgi:hypothetical protein